MRWFLVLALFACDGEDDDDGTPVDAGIVTDTGARADTGINVGRDGGLTDAGGVDAGAPSCPPFTSDAPENPSPTTGRIDVVDYDFYDDINRERSRVRNAGFNFFTGNLALTTITAGLYPAIPTDGCVVTDILRPTGDPRPKRNVGTRITITNEAATKQITLSRGVDQDGLRYEAASQQDLLNFFDPTYLAFDERWTYASDGDAAANIQPVSRDVAAFDDFTLFSPAVSSSSTAVMLDSAGADFTWTSTGAKGIVTIVISRALNPEGDGRYIICRADDDGAFTVPASSITDFAAPDIFGVFFARSAITPFCNEGVPAGAVRHVLAFIGTGFF